MGTVIWAPKARVDLSRIAEFIAQHNLRASQNLIDAVNTAVKRLGDFPHLGPERSEIGTGVRSYPIGNYVLFYKPIEIGIVLLRIIDGRRDLDQAMRE